MATVADDAAFIAASPRCRLLLAASSFLALAALAAFGGSSSSSSNGWLWLPTARVAAAAGQPRRRKAFDSGTARCSAWCPGTHERPVIVIGGGMAGVAAARELRRMGCPVRLIEAKGHLGGRTYGEVQEGGWAFNHGANWIHGAFPNPLWVLNKEKGLVRTQWLPETYYARTTSGIVRDHGNSTYVPGQAFRESFDNFVQQHAHFMDFLSLSCQGRYNSRDLPVTYFVQDYLQSTNVSGRTLDDFLLYYNVYQTLDFARDLYSASMLNYIGRAYNRDREFMLVDPYNRIVDYMAEGLDITVNQPVSLVEYNDYGVRVHARSGEVYDGTLAIVTVPVGVLQTPTISFQPPLPPWKQRAIYGMGMGLLEKIAFEFDSPWWEAAGATEDALWTVKQGERAGFKSTASEWYNLHNLLNKTVPPVLLTTPGGYFADALEFVSDQEVIGIFMEELRSIFPGIEVPVPRKIWRTKHRQDEFMRGSYFSPAVGTDPLSMNLLAEPVANRLLFAGEATSTTRFGYADGAYETGLRAATQALALCGDEGAPIAFDYTGLDAARAPGEDRIRLEWRAQVEAVLGQSIPNCSGKEALSAGHRQPVANW